MALVVVVTDVEGFVGGGGEFEAEAAFGAFVAKGQGCKRSEGGVVGVEPDGRIPGHVWNVTDAGFSKLVERIVVGLSQTRPGLVP